MSAPTVRTPARPVKAERPLAPLAPIDSQQRYDVETALRYLRISRKTFYRDVAAGRIRISKHGSRTFCHGSEIIRVSAA